MIKADKKLTTPYFSLSGTVLNICNEAKYLGHYITDDQSDDCDIHIQYRLMYAQATTLIRKYGMEKEKKNRRNYEMERKTEPQPAAVGS